MSEDIDAITHTEVAEAIRGSIAKWEAIVAGTGEDDGPDNCPLCQTFWLDFCRGCPVRGRTGHSFCGGSPYDQWLDEATTENAQAELDFLHSILAEHEAKAAK